MLRQAYSLVLVDHQMLRDQLATKIQVLDPEIQAIVFEEGKQLLRQGRLFRFYGMMRWLDELATEQEFHRVPRWFNC